MILGRDMVDRCDGLLVGSLRFSCRSNGWIALFVSQRTDLGLSQLNIGRGNSYFISEVRTARKQLFRASG
jgi:hypothetical protein